MNESAYSQAAQRGDAVVSWYANRFSFDSEKPEMVLGAIFGFHEYENRVYKELNSETWMPS